MSQKGDKNKKEDENKHRLYLERVLEAERLSKRSQPEKPKRKWLKTRCSYCGYEISYVPMKNWDGTLKCPECQMEFKVRRLNDWT